MRLPARAVVLGVLALLALPGAQPRHATSAIANPSLAVACSSLLSPLLSRFTIQSQGLSIASAAAMETGETDAPSRLPDAAFVGDDSGAAMDAGWSVRAALSVAPDGGTSAGPAEDSHPFAGANIDQASVQPKVPETEISDPGGDGALDPPELMMLDLINGERIESGLVPLGVDEKLVQLARIRSLDMAEKNYFSHTAPDGSNARSLMIDSQIGPGAMGEVLGRNNSTDVSQSVTSVVKAFLSSPGHHAAMLNPRFVWAGVGTAVGQEDMSYYTVLFFGP